MNVFILCQLLDAYVQPIIICLKFSTFLLHSYESNKLTFIRFMNAVV